VAAVNPKPPRAALADERGAKRGPEERLAIAIAARLVVLVGCGARTELLVDGVTEVDGGNPVAGGDAGKEVGASPDGSSSSDSGVANEAGRSVMPGVTCSLGTTGVAGGGGSCEVKSSETCSDGMTYAAECSCPAATCSCSESSGQGGSSGGGIPFTGCTGTCSFTLSVELAYEACGFPH
jgi:hypothetical protein